MGVIKEAMTFAERLAAFEEKSPSPSPEPVLRTAHRQSPRPVVRPVVRGGAGAPNAAGAYASNNPDPLPAAVRMANADALPPHNQRDLGPEGRRDILDAFSRHVMGGGGFADRGLRLASLPQSEQRGRSRLRSIEQVQAGIAHVQAQIRTARLREPDGEAPGWEDHEHDEEAACNATASLGREGSSSDEVPEPERGYEVGAKGWEGVREGSVIGWRVQVVYWDRCGQPRWHPGFVIDYRKHMRMLEEFVHVFFTEDHVDQEFSVFEPTLAFKKPKTVDTVVSAETVRWAKGLVNGGDGDAE